jgi:hypothetical protein
MPINRWRAVLISVAILSFSAASASAQSTPVDPSTASIRNPNPASSTTTDEEGNNPLAREGDHSPTGQQEAMNEPSVYQPIEDITVGVGRRSPASPSMPAPKGSGATDKEIEATGNLPGGRMPK